MDIKLKRLLFKTALFVLSLSIAWWIIKTGIVHELVDKILPVQFLAEILAGMLYTTFLTSPIAVAMLLVIADSHNPIVIALLGGLGAASVDFLIVRFFRDNSKDINEASHQLQLEKVYKFLKPYNIDFLIPILGAVVIASPLPDELGLLMLGASKLKYRELFILTFVLNAAGILTIVAPMNLLLQGKII